MTVTEDKPCELTVLLHVLKSKEAAQADAVRDWLHGDGELRVEHDDALNCSQAEFIRHFLNYVRESVSPFLVHAPNLATNRRRSSAGGTPPVMASSVQGGKQKRRVTPVAVSPTNAVSEGYIGDIGDKPAQFGDDVRSELRGKLKSHDIPKKTGHARSFENRSSGISLADFIKPKDAKGEANRRPNISAEKTRDVVQTSSAASSGAIMNDRGGDEYSIARMIPDPDYESIRTLAEIYGMVLREFLSPNTAKEIHLLFRLLSIGSSCDPFGIVPDRGEMGYVIRSSTDCELLAAETLARVRPLIELLNPKVIKALSTNKILMKAKPEYAHSLQATVQSIEEDKVKNSASSAVSSTLHDEVIVPNDGPGFIMETDSALSFQTAKEKQIYYNRQKSKDAFLHMKRQWANAQLRENEAEFRRSIAADVRNLFPSGIGEDDGRAKGKVYGSTSRGEVVTLHPANIAWFASSVFVPSLLQTSTGDLDTDAVAMRFKQPRDIERLKILQGRMSTPFKTKQDSDAYVDVSNEDVLFDSNEEFYKFFIDQCQTFRFIAQLRIVLVNVIIQLMRGSRLQNFTLSSRESTLVERALYLSAAAKFLGYVDFSAGFDMLSGESIAISAELSQYVGMRNDANVMLDVTSYLQRAIEGNFLILAVPWIVQYMKMASKDPVACKTKVYVSCIWGLKSARNRICNEKGHINSILIISILDDGLQDLQVDILARDGPPPEVSGLGSVQCECDSFDTKASVAGDRFERWFCPYVADFESVLITTTNNQSASKKITPLPATSTPRPQKLGQQSSDIDIQMLLRDEFFKQHPSLSGIVDSVVRAMVVNAVSVGQGKLESHLEAINKPKQVTTITEVEIAGTAVSLEASKTYCEAHATREALSILAPIGARDDVLDVATTLAKKSATELSSKAVTPMATAYIRHWYQKRGVPEPSSENMEVSGQGASSKPGIRTDEQNTKDVEGILNAMHDWPIRKCLVERFMEISLAELSSGEKLRVAAGLQNLIWNCISKSHGMSSPHECSAGDDSPLGAVRQITTAIRPHFNSSLVKTMLRNILMMMFSSPLLTLDMCHACSHIVNTFSQSGLLAPSTLEDVLCELWHTVLNGETSNDYLLLSMDLTSPENSRFPCCSIRWFGGGSAFTSLNILLGMAKTNTET